MSTFKDKVSTAWDKLNPVDPSPIYLAKFMGFVLFVFAVALTVGALAT